MLLKPSRIALAQISSVLGDVERNVARHIEWTERAIERGADAIVFPELSLTGYTLRDLNFEIAVGGESGWKKHRLRCVRPTRHCGSYRRKSLSFAVLSNQMNAGPFITQLCFSKAAK